MKELGQVLFLVSSSALLSYARDTKLLPIFQVVRFPNDPCAVTAGSKNGTCYTAEECSSKGGTNAGSCASGFGVCCTFTLNCGGSSSENCTYFDSSTTVAPGACKTKICKCSTDICQIRLDFSNFVISGPSTNTISIGKALNGVLAGIAEGFAAADASQCLTDTFSITNQENLPLICGVNSGYHVYFDADDDCHQLNFQLGNNANGLTTIATRSWSIKVSQYSCDYENLAPTGCDQYHFASGASNYVQTFNFQDGKGTGKHLANQHQQICIRREAGMCRICYTVDTIADDIGITGVVEGKAGFKGEDCCGYGADGAGGTVGGGDCIIIPGGSKGAVASAVGVMLLSDAFCGSMMGLNTDGIAAMPKTVCSTQTPFRIEFLSDNFEVGGAAIAEAAGGQTGFKIRYFQTSC